MMSTPRGPRSVPTPRWSTTAPLHRHRRIRWWLAHGSTQFTSTRTTTGVEDRGDGVHVVHDHLEGDFPGGEVDLRHRFERRDGLIHHLGIAP